MSAEMSTRFQQSPELKAFIYQQVLDLQPYTTSTTTVGVVLDESESDRLLRAKKTWEEEPLRVTLVMKDGEAQLSAVGEGSNVYEAISQAKKHLLNQLILVQDSVVSSKERAQEIYETLHPVVVH